MEGENPKNVLQARWDIPHAVQTVLDKFGIIVLICLLANIVVLAACGTLLKTHHPRSLGFRDTIVRLYIVSAVGYSLIFTSFEMEQTENDYTAPITAPSLYFVTSLHLYYSFSFLENLRLLWDVRSFENSNDTDVALLTTYYLAVYNDCCFLADEEIPALDCNSTDFEVPCYEDEELFDEFRNSFEVSNKKCVALTLFDPEDDASSDGFCKKGVRSFFESLATKVYRRLWILSATTLSYGLLTLWYASERFLWGIGGAESN